jgi:hypothetical protein
MRCPIALSERAASFLFSRAAIKSDPKMRSNGFPETEHLRCASMSRSTVMSCSPDSGGALDTTCPDSKKGRTSAEKLGNDSKM